MNKEQITILKEDIRDTALAAGKAYEDMLKASEWYRNRSEKLEQLQEELQALEK